MFFRSKLTFMGIKSLSLADLAVHAISAISQLGTSAILASQVVTTDVDSKLVIEYFLKGERFDGVHSSTTLSYLKNDPLVGVKIMIARDQQQIVPIYNYTSRGPASISTDDQFREIRNKPNDSNYSGSRSNIMSPISNRNSSVFNRFPKTSNAQPKTIVESKEKSKLSKSIVARDPIRSPSSSSKINATGNRVKIISSANNEQDPMPNTESPPTSETPALDPIVSGPIIADLSQRDVARTMTPRLDGSLYIGGDLGPSQKDLFLIKFKSNGTIDGTFGGGLGFVTTSVGTQARGYSIAAQNDNKILLGGCAFIPGNQEDFVIARFLTDGSLDLSWGGTGLVTNDYLGRQDELLSLQLQGDGKIVATGYVGTPGAVKEHLAVIRFNVDGTLDSTFAGTGIAVFNLSGNSRGTSLAIQSDGKIVVGGYVKVGSLHNGVVTRINSDGSLDNSFSTGGLFTIDLGSNEKINSIKVTNSGRIIFAGSVTNANQDLLIGRLNASGILDTSFASSGLFILDLQSDDDDAKTLSVNGDESLYIGGTSLSLDSDAFILKLLSNGSIDSSFSSSGLLIKDIKEDDSISALEISPDGGLIMSGTSVFNGASHSDLFLFKIP